MQLKRQLFYRFELLQSLMCFDCYTVIWFIKHVCTSFTIIIVKNKQII